MVYLLQRSYPYIITFYAAAVLYCALRPATNIIILYHSRATHLRIAIVIYDADIKAVDYNIYVKMNTDYCVPHARGRVLDRNERFKNDDNTDQNVILCFIILLKMHSEFEEKKIYVPNLDQGRI